MANRGGDYWNDSGYLQGATESFMCGPCLGGTEYLVQVRGIRAGGVTSDWVQIGPYTCSTTTQTIDATAITGMLATASLPLATVSTVGAVQPDGTTITVGGVLSAVGGGGASPAFPGPNAAWLFDDFLSASFSSALGWVQNGGGAGTYYNNGPAGAANHPGNWNLQANGSGQWGYVILGPYNTAATASITTAVDATILASCVVATPIAQRAVRRGLAGTTIPVALRPTAFSSITTMWSYPSEQTHG